VGNRCRSCVADVVPRPVGWSERRQRIDGSADCWSPMMRGPGTQLDGMPGGGRSCPAAIRHMLLFFHGGGYCRFDCQSSPDGDTEV
jgi:hypothetical protein